MTYKLEHQPPTWGQWLVRKLTHLCMIVLAFRGALALAGM